jgi:4a-hydroxytetrahydrobiopterin dehydratase
MPLLTAQERSQLAEQHPGWSIDGDSVTRAFGFEDFVEAMGFVNQVALLAEKAFHHPDIDIRWNTVTLTLTTHSEGGLTHKDTAMVEAIDGRV